MLPIKAAPELCPGSFFSYYLWSVFSDAFLSNTGVKQRTPAFFFKLLLVSKRDEISMSTYLNYDVIHENPPAISISPLLQDFPVKRILQAHLITKQLI